MLRMTSKCLALPGPASPLTHSTQSQRPPRCGVEAPSPCPPRAFTHHVPLRGAAFLTHCAGSSHRTGSAPAAPPLSPSPSASSHPLMGPGAAPSLLCSSLQVCLRPGSPVRTWQGLSHRAHSDSPHPTQGPAPSRRSPNTRTVSERGRGNRKATLKQKGLRC